MTQLTSMLEHGLSIETLAQVVLIFVVLFWMYSGYVWLTNQVPPVTTASRLLLIAGMAGFLVCALAVPHAFDGDGVAFAIGFFVVIVVHSGMFASAYGRGTLGFVPLNFVGATSITAAALIGGTAAYALWLVPIVLTFVSSTLTQRDRGRRVGVHLPWRTPRGTARPAARCVRRVDRGDRHRARRGRARTTDVRGRGARAAARVGGSGRTYFTGGRRCPRGVAGCVAAEQLGMAIGAFFYAFVVMLLGVVILAAGLALTIAAVDVRTSFETAALLGGGAALYVAGDVSSGSSSGSRRCATDSRRSPVLLATIPLGSGVSGMAQLLAIIAVFVAVLLFESAPGPGRHRSRMTTSRSSPIRRPTPRPVDRAADAPPRRRPATRTTRTSPSRVEADDGIGREVGQPHAIVVVDVDGVGLRAVAGSGHSATNRPRGRGRRPGRRSIPPPTAAPSRRTRCGGRPARPSVVPRRSPHRFPVDPGDVAAGERRVPDVPGGRRGDPVGSAAAGASNASTALLGSSRPYMPD